MARASVRCLLALQLVGLPAPAYAQAPGGPAIPASTAPMATGNTDASQKAKDLYAARRYVEAARAFEAIDTPAALYNAGMARQAGGHTAHAIRDWQRYLETAAEVSPEERAELLQDIAEAQAVTVAVRFTADPAPSSRTLILHAATHRAGDDLKIPWPADLGTLAVHLDAGDWSAVLHAGAGETPAIPVQVRSGETPEISLAVAPLDATPVSTATPVRLRVGPDAALGRGVEVAWSGPGSAPASQQIKIIRGSAANWDLSPGTWTLKASARGFEPTEQVVTVSGAPVDVDLMLRRDRQAQARLGLSIAFGVATVGLVAGGAALFAAGKNQDQLLRGRLDGIVGAKSFADTLAFQDDIKQQTTGIAVMAGGGGAMIVAATTAAGGRLRALGVEAGLGGLLIIAGAPWLVHAKGCGRRLVGSLTFEVTTEAMDQCAQGEVPAAVLLGMGIGMLGGAGVAMVVQRALRKKPSKIQASLGGGPGGASLYVQGRF